jgi:hypothetical protein
VVLPVSGQEVPPEDLPEAANQPAQPNLSGQEVPPEDLPSAPDQGSGLLDTWKTGVEAVRRGVLGPLAGLEEKYLPDTAAAEEQKAEAQRAEAHPFVAGAGELAGLVAGPIGAGISAAGTAAGAAAKAAEVGKFASSVIKNTLETSLFLGVDKASRAMQEGLDPHEAAPSSLMADGAVSLLGGVGGAAIERVATPALRAIGESNIGTKLSQFVSDAGSRLKFWNENPNVTESTAEQMGNLLASNDAARDYMYGSGQGKASNIARLTQDVTQDQVDQHVNDVAKKLSSLSGDLQNNSGLQDIVREWKDSVTPKIDPITLQPIGRPPTPADVFQATDSMKRRVGDELAEFQKRERDLTNKRAGALYHDLGTTLEDSDVWNDAGDFQKRLNASVSNFMPANKDFLRKFSESFSPTPLEDEGNKVIKSGTVETYLNQQQKGKLAGSDKARFVQRWVNGSENMQQEINALHSEYGLESPLFTPPTELIKDSYGEKSAGAKFADSLYQFGVPGFANRAAHGVAGAAIGEQEGYKQYGIPGAIGGGVAGALTGAIVPHFEEAIGRKVKQSVLPFVVKALSGNAPHSAGKVLGYAESAAKGAGKLSDGINSLFKAGGARAVDAITSDKDKEKIDKYLENGELDRQFQSQIQQPAPSPTPSQKFAHGGEVIKPEPVAMPDEPVQPALRGFEKLGKALPDHAAMLAGAKVRVANYLNSVRPQKPLPKLAFDTSRENTDQHRSYQKALDLAIQPLGILNHIKAGTLTPETLNHFKSLWPEIHDHMSKKLTQKIMQAGVDEEKPSYRVRQGLSMFLGTPLDSTMTPQAIQSVQAMYAPKPMPAQAGVSAKAKKNTSKLGKIPEDHYTMDQAAAKRQTAWD